MGAVSDRVLDFGLDVLSSEATAITLCQAEPTNYDMARINSSNALGFRSFGAGATFGAPGPNVPNGRKVTSTAITDGTITTSGSVNFYAVIDDNNGRLLARQALVNGAAESAGNRFSLASFAIRIPASQ